MESTIELPQLLYRESCSRIDELTLENELLANTLSIEPTINPSLAAGVSVLNRFDINCSPSLWQCWAMAYNGKYLLTGGKKGLVKLFNTELQQENYTENYDIISSYEVDYLLPVVEWGAACRWISSIKFINPIISKSIDTMALITADDGSLSLWNINELLRYRYPEVMDAWPIDSVQPSNLHDNHGIYSMDINKNIISTAGKNGSICISQLDNSGIIPNIRELYGIHKGTIKSVKMLSENILASGGNDQSVNIYDLRSNQHSALVLSITSAHSAAVNTVEWRSEQSYQLLSSSFDKSCCIFDLRRISYKPEAGPQPLFRINRHWQHFSGSRAPNIYHPIYINNGAYIAASSTSNNLFLFSSINGELIRTIPLGYSANQLLGYQSESESESESGLDTGLITFNKRSFIRMKLL